VSENVLAKGKEAADAIGLTNLTTNSTREFTLEDWDALSNLKSDFGNNHEIGQVSEEILAKRKEVTDALKSIGLTTANASEFNAEDFANISNLQDFLGNNNKIEIAKDSYINECSEEILKEYREIDKSGNLVPPDPTKSRLGFHPGKQVFSGTPKQLYEYRELIKKHPGAKCIVLSERLMQQFTEKLNHFLKTMKKEKDKNEAEPREHLREKEPLKEVQNSDSGVQEIEKEEVKRSVDKEVIFKQELGTLARKFQNERNEKQRAKEREKKLDAKERIALDKEIHLRERNAENIKEDSQKIETKKQDQNKR